jgi:hypothetical protein
MGFICKAGRVTMSTAMSVLPTILANQIVDEEGHQAGQSGREAEQFDIYIRSLDTPTGTSTEFFPGRSSGR